MLALTALIVLAPPLYVVAYVALNWGSVWREAFHHEIVGAGYWEMILRSLWLSLRLALATVAVDLLIGVPLSYLIARRRVPGRWVLEDLTTLTLVVPTSAYGFAILIAWSNPSGLASLLGLDRGLVPQGALVPVVNVPALLLLTHVALTLPYLVRPLVAVIESMGEAYELVSRSLGAPSLTTFRRVTLPLALPSLVSSSVLAMTRSLGETGATIIVAGVSVTASVAIVRLVYEFKLGLASLLASMLVASTLLLVLPVELLSKRLGLGREVRPSRREYALVRLEKRLSGVRPLAVVVKALLVSTLLLIVLAPLAAIFKAIPEYWSCDPYTGRPEGGILYQVFGPAGYLPRLLRATLNSFLVASIATLSSIYISVLLFTIARRGRLGTALRALIRIPLIVPTSAMGLSSLLLFGEGGLGLAGPSIWLTMIVHTSFSVPIVFETLMATYESLEVDSLEEVARTLGATPYDALETVTLPVLKRGITAGAVLAFLHSLGETGATMIVMGRDVTLPVLVVNMAEALAVPAALFTSACLLAYALATLIILRRLQG
ncbi:MAG: iron ABC transporter permease [Thermoproteales archaeon]|nr:iron ABC transporter permease [Thermoproteales archaeon]